MADEASPVVAPVAAEPAATPPPAAVDDTATPAPADEPAEAQDGDGAAAPATPPADEAAAPAPVESTPEERKAKREEESRARLEARRFKLDRWETKVKAERAELLARSAELTRNHEAMLAQQARLAPLAAALEKVKDNPLGVADEICGALGWTRKQFYEALTYRELNNAPSPEEQRRQIAADITRDQQAAAERAFDAQVQSFAAAAPGYMVVEGGGFTKFPALRIYTPESVAATAVARVVNAKRQGVDITLDAALGQIQSEKLAEIQALSPHLSAGANGGTPNGSNGAATAASPTASQNGKVTSISNRQSAAAGTGKERAKTDKELTQEAVALLRARGFR